MKHRVMVVDDEPSVSRTVHRILEMAGYDVITVDNGMACLEQLAEGFKGLILMDVMMPGMDGWDTIEKIVENGYARGNIICMLTAKEKPDAKMERLKEYILDYILKPFSAKQLTDVVNEYSAYLED